MEAGCFQRVAQSFIQQIRWVGWVWAPLPSTATLCHVTLQGGGRALGTGTSSWVSLLVAESGNRNLLLFLCTTEKKNLKGHYSCWIGYEQGYPAEILIIQAIMKLILLWQICRATLPSAGNTVDNYFVREGSWEHVRVWGCIFFTCLKPYFHFLCLQMPCLHIYECVPWPAKSLPSSAPEMCFFFCRSFLFGNFTGNDGLV